MKHILTFVSLFLPNSILKFSNLKLPCCLLEVLLIQIIAKLELFWFLFFLHSLEKIENETTF